MLGIRPDYDRLVIDPCIPKAWDGFTVRRVWRGATYDIEVQNPQHVSKGVKTILVNGTETEYIPAMAEGENISVKVIMG